MHNCNFCNTVIDTAFVGTKNERKIHSCFNCFISTLKPFKFDEEYVYYPIFGSREIQLEDTAVFYNIDGKELARVFLKTYESGFLSFLKVEIANELNLPLKGITILIEPHNVQLKE